MKNKPTRHKEINTFKFQPFSERVNNIDVNLLHRIAHENETQEEDESYFHQAVDKWTVLNLTEKFGQFRKEIRSNNLITLPQLIIEKDRVVDVLKGYLKQKDPLCIQPLLELTIAFAQDLHNDFYPYFEEFLEILIDLLNTKDTEQLEWIFHCLAHLFKLLWRPLIKDIRIVFNAILPLLSDNKPEYINSFAAECFAFVARKLKDRPTFLNVILKAIKSKRDGVDGCSKLFFEIISGVPGQFHSCAEVFLPFLLEALLDDKFPQKVLFEVLEKVIAQISVKIQAQHTGVLWTSLLNTLTKSKKIWIDNKEAEDGIRNMELVLKLLGQAIEYYNGKLLRDPAPVINKIVEMLKETSLPESVLRMLTQISILLLLSSRIKLSQEQASLLTRKILALPNARILLYFVDNITDFSSFEALVLPTFLTHCTNNDLDIDSFKVLTNIILKKSPPAMNGIKFGQTPLYLLNFASRDNNIKIEQIMKNHIAIEDFSKLFDNFDAYFCSMVCIPHSRLVEKDEIVKQLNENVLSLIHYLNNFENMEDESQLKKYLFALNLTVECLFHCGSFKELRENFDFLLKSLLRFCTKIQFLPCLKLLDMIMTVFSKKVHDIINMTTLKILDEDLADNFCSPYHEMRLLTSHIYTLFEDIPEFEIRYSPDPEVPPEDFRVFSICYKAESIKPSVQTYREQLRLLESLGSNKPQMIMCSYTDFKTIPLRYLCGFLYINFKLLWKPVIDIIESQAHSLDIQDFWDVYGQELMKASLQVRKKHDTKVDFLDTDYISLRNAYEESQKLSGRPDFINYRLLLWKAMGEFVDVAEAKTRTVAEVFLDFIESEYMGTNSSITFLWNIKENDKDNKADDEDAHEELEDQEADQADKSVEPLVRLNAKNKLRTLLECLGVFSNIKSPKSMYREPELHQVYFDMLSHKSADVQKVALNCLLTYKYKYLTPYKENLLNLIDEKNFKNELAMFHVDQESDLVLPDHRPDLMPIVLKIVYSKMSTRTGMRTGGKTAGGQIRRNLVIRFLMGCTQQEMLMFVRMAFKVYIPLIQENPKEMVDSISCNVDLEKIIPPKRLMSTLNLLDVMFTQLGSLMGSEVLNYMLNTLLIIGATVNGVFSQLPLVHAGYLSILKQIRNSAIGLVEKFFDHFETFPWTSKQTNALFEVFVWPYIDKLSTDGIHSPTALLKLFIQWGGNPLHFPLLVKHHQNDESQYVLPHVFQLFLNEKSHGSVINAIECMLEKLLTLQASEEELNQVIPVDNLLPVKDEILARIKVDETLNYGSCILLPFIPSILEKIRRKLSTKSKNLNRKELFILSRISELVWESDISDSVLDLLLPVILKKCSKDIDETVMLQFMTTVKNLLNNIDNPEKHVVNISPLFGEVSYIASRKLLVATLTTIASKSEDASLKKTSKVLKRLNAWDQEFVDQPDLEKRHKAFQKIHKEVENDGIDVRLAILLIYNCYFFMEKENDHLLKENAAHCLKALCPQLIKKHQGSQVQMDYILNTTLFNLISKGMKSKNEEHRNHSISLLGHLARECPDSHFILRDLNIFTNAADPEVDFFRNLVHIQTHRRARALVKFTQITKDLTTALNVRTLTQFILPLITSFLCNEKYMGKSSIVDAGIEAIGVISRLLPWHQYEVVLKFYLTRLQKKVSFQKQLVRLIVVILDGFHFDLSKGMVLEIEKDLAALKQSGKGASPNHAKNEASENTDDVEMKEMDKGEPKKDDSQATVESTQEDEIEEEADDEDGESDDEEGFQGGSDEEESSDGESVEEEENEEKVEQVKIYEKTAVLCKSTATRVIRTIQIVLLPQLNKTLAQRTYTEGVHKVNKKKTRDEQEEEDLIRVPISLAVVKLLQRLPKEILERNLPGVFMKLCTFLKSRMHSVRRLTRETFQDMMVALGPEYLRVLLAEIPPLLTRGYHAHVLVHTVHGVLSRLKEKELYQPTHIDNVLLTVLELCKADLFGVLSEEKEVDKIRIKISEAKSTKSYDTLRILAQFVTEKCLLDLLMPIKDILLTTHSHKLITRAKDALRNIATGLIDNQFVPVESLLKFAYGTTSESISDLKPVEKPVLTAVDIRRLQREKPDTFIVPKNPGRSGAKASIKPSAKTNSSVLVEFGLVLSHLLLKRDKLKDGDYRAFLDPFVVVFKDCLLSRYVTLCTMTLKCLSWIMKYDLPSLKEHIDHMTNIIMMILHKYASAGLSKGPNFDLVLSAFKAMAVMVRDVKNHPIKLKHLKLLLFYVEQDMHDFDRQAIAFGLLKAIISRKLIVPEIHATMKKVAELSITSELVHVRAQARSVFFQFILEYPVEKKLEDHLTFYISQMSYEMQYGRESAIEMISMLIHSFPLDVLKEHCGTLMVSLSARLVNDDIPECKKKVAACVTALLNRLPVADRDALFDFILIWLKDKKIIHRRMAVQICGIFVSVEKESFGKRLRALMPLILLQFGIDNLPGRYVRIKKDPIIEEDSEQSAEEYQRLKDHHLYMTFLMLVKLCVYCPAFLKNDEIQTLANQAQTLLSYPHEWVRLGAAQFIGSVLATIDVEKLSNLFVNNESEESGYLVSDPENSIKSLTLDLCDQLQPAIINELAEQVIKNLVFIALVLQQVPVKTDENNKVNLLWLCKQMRKVVNSEIVNNPNSKVLRHQVFLWIAAVTKALNVENIKPVAPHLLGPLIREMAMTTEDTTELRQLAKDACKLLKKKLGLEFYTNCFVKSQQYLQVKRDERKRKRHQLAITDPEMFAKKKIKKQEKKKGSRKRKLDELKGRPRVHKKRRVAELEDDFETS